MGRVGLLFACSLILSGLLVALGGEKVPPEKEAAVKKAIQDYIKQDQGLKGSFLIKDEQAGTIRELTFDYVHDGVSKTGEGRYVACVDFKQSQKVLDLDFYVQPSPSGELRVSEIVIHRIDGKEVTKK